MFFIYNYSLFCFSPHYIHLHTHKTAYKEMMMAKIIVDIMCFILVYYFNVTI